MEPYSTIELDYVAECVGQERRGVEVKWVLVLFGVKNCWRIMVRGLRLWLSLADVSFSFSLLLAFVLLLNYA